MIDRNVRTSRVIKWHHVSIVTLPLLKRENQMLSCFEAGRDWRYNRSLEIERLLNVRKFRFHVISVCFSITFPFLSLSAFSLLFPFFFWFVFDRWLTWNLLEVTDGRLLAHKLWIFLFRKFDAFIFKSAIIHGKEFPRWIQFDKIIYEKRKLLKIIKF